MAIDQYSYDIPLNSVRDCCVSPKTPCLDPTEALCNDVVKIQGEYAVDELVQTFDKQT